jgi:hypothetical protein
VKYPDSRDLIVSLSVPIGTRSEPREPLARTRERSQGQATLRRAVPPVQMSRDSRHRVPCGLLHVRRVEDQKQGRHSYRGPALGGLSWGITSNDAAEYRDLARH